MQARPAWSRLRRSCGRQACGLGCQMLACCDPICIETSRASRRCLTKAVACKDSQQQTLEQVTQQLALVAWCP